MESATNSQSWRGTPSSRKVSTPSWMSLRQPADNVKGDSEQAEIMELPITASKKSRGEIRHEDDHLQLLECAREQRNHILQEPPNKDQLSNPAFQARLPFP